MKIFYQISTGQILGTVDGFDDKRTQGVRILPANVPEEDIAEEIIAIGHPKEELARKLMDPRDELGIHLLKVGGEGVVEMDQKEKKAVVEDINKREKERKARLVKAPDGPTDKDRIAALEKQVADLIALNVKPLE